MQKFGQTVVFLIAFVGAAALIYFVAAPRLLPPTSGPTTPLSPPSSEISRTDPVPPVSDAAPSHTPIAPPRSASQREADDIEARRVPYYQWLHSKFGDILTSQEASSADAATLDLYTSRSDSSVVLPLIGQAVTPYADQYGFNHVRFFLPNPPGSVERYRFAAEASPDREGKWRAFEK